MGVQVVIVSGVRLYREGLALALESGRDRVEVIGSCRGAEDAAEFARAHASAVLLVDLESAGGLGGVRRLVRAVPTATVVALALAPADDGAVIAAAESGIGGYVPPEATVEELLEAIETAARGEMSCNPRVTASLARRLATLTLQVRAEESVEALTVRELEVLELLNAGLSNKQIARQLSIRLATVKNHVHSILAKLNVKRRGEAAAAVVRRDPWTRPGRGRQAEQPLTLPPRVESGHAVAAFRASGSDARADDPVIA